MPFLRKTHVMGFLGYSPYWTTARCVDVHTNLGNPGNLHGSLFNRASKRRKSLPGYLQSVTGTVISRSSLSAQTNILYHVRENKKSSTGWTTFTPIAGDVSSVVAGMNGDGGVVAFTVGTDSAQAKTH